MAAGAPSRFAEAAAALRSRRIRSARLRRIAERADRIAPTDAERELKAYLTSCPDDPDALRLLGKLIATTNRSVEAEALLRRCLEVAPAFTAARFDYAKLLERMSGSKRRWSSSIGCL